MVLVLHGFPAASAAGVLGDKAVQCAAYNFGQWDYEVANFDAADRSDGWKDQANGFAAVARRDGLSDTQVAAYIKRHRSAMKALITASIFNPDAQTERTIKALDRQCGKIIRQEPEMSPHR